MKLVSNTLYAQSDGLSLHLDGESIRVTRAGAKLQTIPLVSVSTLVVFSGVGVTSSLMERLTDEGKGVYLLSCSGRLRLKAEGPAGRSVLLRIQQYDCFFDDGRRLQLAKQFVAGKLANQKYELYRLQRSPSQRLKTDRLQHARSQIAEAVAAVDNTSTLAELMGWEGNAARAYFDAWGITLRPIRTGQPWRIRTRRPPKSPEDALLSFGYSLLLRQYATAAEMAGLDPYLGFLHSPAAGRESLALDLLEEVRAPFVDAWVSVMCARQEIQVKHFEPSDGTSFTLGEEGRRKVLISWQHHMDSEICLPGFAESVPRRFVPLHQARLLARAFRDGGTYVPFDSSRAGRSG